ncbi:dTDP-4-amino-4,6-dideoxygalactose transaminase [Endozoicomonas sp. 2B-B]
MTMIAFNKPACVGNEEAYVLDAMKSTKISGDGQYTKKCHHWFESTLPCKKALLTPSCTHALEMAAILINTQPGDEIIMSSFTFVSTANAFVLRGAKIVFVDIRKDTMNIDENLIEAAITEKTKAIVPVHYAGVACEMDKIMELAKKYKLYVIEDAAQGMLAEYNGYNLGTIGHIGTFSFHETKNFTSGGEGGLLIVNDESLIDRAEIIREKGTNRSKFISGLVDKYSWVDVGSSYLPSELQAAYLFGQIQHSEEIISSRLDAWHNYYERLKPFSDDYKFELPPITVNKAKHNGHIFYVKVKEQAIRDDLIAYLKSRNISACFHYIPLHSSEFGARVSVFHGVNKFTSTESLKLIRLPIYHGITDNEISVVCQSIINYFNARDSL